MKQKVRLDTFSIMLSGIVLIILLCTLHFTNSVLIISIITAVVIIWGSLALYYMPLSISVENGDLCVNCPFRTKRISLEEINYIERLQPQKSDRRIFGSYGWFGYWGCYKGRTLGKYIAYYGNASDCFIVRLRNGRQYVLGCDNPDAIVNYIKSEVSF